MNKSQGTIPTTNKSSSGNSSSGNGSSSSSSSRSNDHHNTNKEYNDGRTVIQKISRILQIWTMVSTHMRVRDRSVKTLQYGCQMLIGYYGKELNDTMRDTLAFTRRTCSNARKAFWLMKSLNHIDSCMSMMMKVMDGTTKVSMTVVLDIIEQIFLVLYYAYENLVFFTRVKLLTSITESDIDTFGNWSWFIGDFACFVAALLRFYDHFIRWLRIKFYEQVTNDSENRFSLTTTTVSNTTSTNYNNTSDNRSSGERNDDYHGTTSQKWYYQQVYENLFCDELGTALTDSFTTVVISGLEMLVSADFCHIWKKLFGRGLEDTGVGFCGMFSSIMTVLEGFRNASRKIP